jgi:hypothetical protein
VRRHWGKWKGKLCESESHGFSTFLQFCQDHPEAQEDFGKEFPDLIWKTFGSKNWKNHKANLSQYQYSIKIMFLI